MPKLALNSASVRRKWIKDGIVNESLYSSFWTMFTGKSFQNPVYMVQDTKQDDGHTVIFNFRGTSDGPATKGDDRLYGNEEDKRMFSDQVTVNRYRFGLNNGTKYDAVTAGDLSLALHSDARKYLADQFIRWKDQACFDTLQGVAGSAPTHRVSFGTNAFDYNALLDLEAAIKTGDFSEGTANTAVASQWAARAPIQPIKMKGTRPMYLLVGDSKALNALKRNAAFQRIAYTGDYRGQDKNMLLTGVIGTIGNFMLMEAPSFYGFNKANIGTGTHDYNNTGTTHCGLRRFKASSTADNTLPAPASWLGDSDFSTAGNEEWTRCLIVGNGALQVAVGMEPEYYWQPSEDYGITSSSALATWMGFRKTQMKVELGDDYAQGVAGIDYGMAAVDIRVG